MTLALLSPFRAQAGADDEEPGPGAWYMAFWSARLPSNSAFGLQGDVQWRNFNMAGDLEQFLFRASPFWTPPNTQARLASGYVYVLYGEPGEGRENFHEHRIYQEALLPQQIGSRVYLQHRLRYEQRWVDDQNFRTRYRYALLFNLPLNQQSMDKGALYLSLYNEVFLNGQRTIAADREVEYFDRNRAYAGLGYFISPNLRLQTAYMQQTIAESSRGQLQAGVHMVW